MPNRPYHVAHLRRLLTRAGLTLASLALIGTGLFSYILGFDNNPQIGPKRAVALVLGLAALGLLVSGILIELSERKSSHTRPATQASSWFSKASAWLERPASFSRTGRILFSAGLVLATVGVYIWVFLLHYDGWPTTTNYTQLQANAYLAGQIHLLEEPSPELLAARYPYSYDSRGNIPLLWDATFYDGKYYLYWGPAPALLLTAFEWIAPLKVGDSTLVLLFTLGTALFTCLVFFELRKSLPAILPVWMLPGALVVIIFNTLLLWLLTRPEIYETAISAGQCFLMAGFAAALRATRSDRKIPWLAAASVMFGLAIASRFTLLPAVFWFMLVVFIKTAWPIRRNWRAAIQTLLALGLPLGLAIAGLGWYNFVRFNSPFETGHRYQLTGYVLPDDPSRVTSLDYILPNIYSYLLRPLQIQLSFPLISAPWIDDTAWPLFFAVPPDYYYHERVASLFLVVPLIGLAALICFWIIWRWLEEAPPLPRPADSIPTVSMWPAAALLGSGLLQWGVLLIFISASLRYLLDLTQIWILIAILIFGWAWKRYLLQPAARFIITALWWAGCGLSFVVSLLMAYTGFH